MTAVDDVAAPPSDFAAYYATGYPRLAAQLYAYLGDVTEAEDLAQEAYLRAWRAWPKISQYDDPVGWVRHVAWNLATSRLRQLTTAARFAARQPTPESTTLAALGPERVVLVAALRKLPERQRRAIVLHYIADVSVADIAAELMVARGTVLSWLHRGRALLATLLGASDQNSADDSRTGKTGSGKTGSGKTGTGNTGTGKNSTDASGTDEIGGDG